jgi:hypothetical protein
VFDIPQHILPIIKEFLIIKISSYDLDKIMRSNRFDGFNWEENKRSWRCFLSMNRSCYWYDTVRYELSEYNLNRYYSLQFLHQDVFRKNLLTKMKNSYQQLSLDLSHFSFSSLTTEQVAILSNIYYIDFSFSSFTSLPKGFRNVYEINFSCSGNLQDVSSLSQPLSSSASSSSSSSFSSSSSSDNLIGVHIINLSHCDKITNVDHLSYLDELHLAYCTRIKSISSLGKIKRLSLRTNDYIRDISMLTGVKELEVIEGGMESWELANSFTSPMTDIPLPQLEKLSLFGIWLSDVSHLINLHTYHCCSGAAKENRFEKVIGLNQLSKCVTLHLDQRNYRNMRFTSKVMPKLKNLTLSTVPPLVKLPSVSHLSSLTLERSSVTSANRFADIRELRLGFCRKLTQVSQLGKVSFLDLHNCSKLSRIKRLGKKNYSLNLSHCYLITDISNLGRIQKLKLDFCRNITDISSLSKVPYLSLRGCTGITDFTSLGKYQKFLDLTGSEVTDVALLNFSTVYELVLSFCSEIRDVSCLTDVVRLTARNCEAFKILNLYGNYIKADFSNCVLLTQVNVFGNIYTLSTIKRGSPGVTITTNVFGSVKVHSDVFTYPNRYNLYEIEGENQQEFLYGGGDHNDVFENGDDESDDDDDVHDDESDDEELNHSENDDDDNNEDFVSGFNGNNGYFYEELLDGDDSVNYINYELIHSVGDDGNGEDFLN